MGWILSVAFVLFAFGLCLGFGAERARWPILAFSVAAFASLSRGRGPAVLAVVMSAALVWRFYRTPPDLTKFWLEIIRDIFGLAGAALTAWAFFRLEKRKHAAEVTTNAPAGNPAIKQALIEVGHELYGLVLRPNDIDAQLTAWGLVLISISFFISISLTIAEFCGLFGHGVAE
jgi:hypothetical protein